MVLSLPAAAVAMAAGFGGRATAGSGTGTFTASRAGCSVEIDIGSRYATAVPGAGCSGGGYWLSSWQLPSEANPAQEPQRLLSAADRYPWTVPLPTGSPCFYQVDFAKRSAPPGQAATSRTLIFSHVGQTEVCASGGTTTVPVATTSPGSTTTSSSTTVPGGTSTTVPPVVPTTVGARTATGTGTTTTTPAGLAANKGQSGAVPVAAPSGAKRSSSRPLAFTGMAVLMVLFVAAVLITAGLGLVRASRESRRVAPAEGSEVAPSEFRDMDLP